MELSQHQERSRNVLGGCSAKVAGVHHYFGRDEPWARLTEHLPDMTRKRRRAMDDQFAQGSATGGVQKHWTAEYVEEQLIAARDINNEQAQSADRIFSAHKSLKEVHSTQNRIAANTART